MYLYFFQIVKSFENSAKKRGIEIELLEDLVVSVGLETYTDEKSILKDVQVSTTF